MSLIRVNCDGNSSIKLSHVYRVAREFYVSSKESVGDTGAKKANNRIFCPVHDYFLSGEWLKEIGNSLNLRTVQFWGNMYLLCHNLLLQLQGLGKLARFLVLRSQGCFCFLGFRLPLGYDNFKLSVFFFHPVGLEASFCRFLIGYICLLCGRTCGAICLSNPDASGFFICSEFNIL